MISRTLTAAALMTGAALLSLPAAAQTGTSAQSTISSGGASPSGSVGTTSNTPRNNSSSTSKTMGPMGGGTTNSPGMAEPTTMAGPRGAMSAQGNTQSAPRGNMSAGADMNYQAQAPRRGAAAERQMTECLNNAAAQRQSFDTCRR
jgi:hypothetical protein